MTSILVVAIIGVMSVISFGVMGLDKLFAKTGRWRISEFSLWMLSLLGGFPGTFLGAFFFRHKTRKRHFWIPVFLAVLVWYAALSLGG